MNKRLRTPACTVHPPFHAGHLHLEFTRTLMSYNTTEKPCKYFKNYSLLSPPNEGYRTLLKGERGEGKGLGNAVRQNNSCLNLQPVRRGDCGKVWWMHSPRLTSHRGPSPTTPATSGLPMASRNCEHHSLGYPINCQQPTKGTAQILGPIGHTSHLFLCICRMKTGTDQCIAAFIINYYFTGVP